MELGEPACLGAASKEEAKESAAETCRRLVGSTEATQFDETSISVVFNSIQNGRDMK